MERVIVSVIEDSEELYGKIVGEVSAAAGRSRGFIESLADEAEDLYGRFMGGLAGNADHGRGLVEKGRPHIESVANAIFSTMMSFHFAGKKPEELRRHLLETFPKVLTANEAAALSAHYGEHLHWTVRELLGQAVGNSVNLSLNIDKIYDNPQKFMGVYGKTWGATQPFRVLSGAALDVLIWGLRQVHDIAKEQERRSRR